MERGVFFSTVTYIQVKQIIKKICRAETRFYPLVVDRMEADLNANLQAIVRNGWVKLLEESNYVTREMFYYKIEL